MNGSKVTSMEVNELDIKFIDSLDFLSMALSILSKTFDLIEISEGSFSHLFNVHEHQDYEGPQPDKHFYGLEDINNKDA